MQAYWLIFDRTKKIIGVDPIIFVNRSCFCSLYLAFFEQLAHVFFFTSKNLHQFLEPLRFRNTSHNTECLGFDAAASPESVPVGAFRCRSCVGYRRDILRARFGTKISVYPSAPCKPGCCCSFFSTNSMHSLCPSECIWTRAAVLLAHPPVAWFASLFERHRW